MHGVGRQGWPDDLLTTAYQIPFKSSQRVTGWVTVRVLGVVAVACVLVGATVAAAEGAEPSAGAASPTASPTESQGPETSAATTSRTPAANASSSSTAPATSAAAPQSTDASVATTATVAAAEATIVVSATIATTGAQVGASAAAGPGSTSTSGSAAAPVAPTSAADAGNAEAPASEGPASQGPSSSQGAPPGHVPPPLVPYLEALLGTIPDEVGSIMETLEALPTILPGQGQAAEAPVDEPRKDARADVGVAAVAQVDPPAVTSPVGVWVAVGGAVAAVGLAAGSSGMGATAFAGLRRHVLRLMLAAGLFSRLTQEDLLENPRRRDLVDFVRENPGERLTVVRDRLGLANGAMLHHLGMLEQRRLIRVVRADGMSRLYPTGPKIEARPYVAPRRQELLEVLRARPGVTQRELATTAKISERVASYHVRWLESRGLMRVEREGGAHRCFPASGAAPAPYHAAPDSA